MNLRSIATGGVTYAEWAERGGGAEVKFDLKFLDYIKKKKLF